MNANTSGRGIPLKQLVKLQIGQSASRKSNWLVLLLFLSAALYALYQGYVDKKAKRSTILAFRQQSDSLLNAMKTGILADTSTQDGKIAFAKSSNLRSGLWNTRVYSYKEPVSTAIYNIGQSDVLPYYYLFTAENFEMQWLKQTETGNPLRALVGHFDMSFWIVYLLPLMLLLLSFNSLSEERDKGNWRLIAAQGISEKAWVKSKLIVVALSAVILILIAGIAGTLINGVVFGQSFSFSDGLFFLIAIFYLFFWLSLFYFINSLRRSTAYNALVSGVSWVGLCLVLPVIISKVGVMAVSIDNTRISSFSRRPQDPRLEQDKLFASGFIKRLSAGEAAFADADADTLSPEFYLRVYHAWHLLLHKERWPVVQDYFHDVESRQELTDLSVLINPAASTDGYLTALADNDAGAFHHFTKVTEQLHANLQHAMFNSLFTKASFSRNDYDRLPAFEYTRNKIPDSIFIYILLIVTSGTALFRISARNLDRPE